MTLIIMVLMILHVWWYLLDPPTMMMMMMMATSRSGDSPTMVQSLWQEIRIWNKTIGIQRSTKDIEEFQWHLSYKQGYLRCGGWRRRVRDAEQPRATRKRQQAIIQHKNRT